MLAILSAAIAMQNPSISELDWMAGHWSGGMFGGIWEENWSAPTKNAIQGHGRLIVDGQTQFMEFMAIEQNSEGKPVLYMVVGALSKGEKKPEAFPMREASDKRVKFAREGDDYPQVIEYCRDGEKLICELSGIDKGKSKTERFEFKKS